ncbi:MAG: T9SS type A sorting domain-containing protein [Candidatus Kapabacteria bacterium]|nr:T9SS type A sorting domain-containing protein [Candidatus Kapabacteria bacterium]
MYRTLYFTIVLLFSLTTLFSQTPIQKWEFVKTFSSVDKEFLHGYNVGVSTEGFTFVSSYHNDQYPIMVTLLPNASELFTFEFNKQSFANYVFKIRSEANDIYKNSTFDIRSLFGLQCTWVDSTNTRFYPADLSYSRNFFVKNTNSLDNFDKGNFVYHSTTHSGYHELLKFISLGLSKQKEDSISFQTSVFQLPNNGKIDWTLDTFTVGTIHKDEYTSLPKPQSMRWYTNTKQLGIMISPDTVIPSSNSIVQVRRSNVVTNIDAKFDDVVDVNPYLVQNFSGKRLNWKGFTNSSYGFVALFENLDNNNQNLLIRYINQNQQFTTVALDTTIDCRSLFLDSLGNLVIVGRKNSSNNNDFYLGFYPVNGDLTEKMWGSEDYDRLNDVIIDSFGEIAVSGQKGNDLYLAKFTLNATTVPDNNTNFLPTLFVSQDNFASNKGEIVLENLESGNTTVKLFSLQGTEVSTIFDGTTFGNGRYRFPIHTANLTSGMYIVVVQNNQNVITKKFIHTP